MESNYVTMGIELATQYLPSIAGVFVLLIIANLVSKWAGKLVVRSLSRSDFDPTLTQFFGNATRRLVLLIAVIACLSVFGVETTSFAEDAALELDATAEEILVFREAETYRINVIYRRKDGDLELIDPEF